MHSIHDQVLGFIDDAGSDSFDAMALAVFSHLFESVAPYRRYCQTRGRTPDNMTDWRQIPPVPIQAFRETELCCGSPERMFLSTGTTAGAAHRSRHRLPDLRLYRRAALGGLRRFLFPDEPSIRIVSLVPPVSAAPESSLAQMAAWAIEEFGSTGSTYALGDEGLDFDRLAALLHESESTGELCCLMTTTGALIRFLDFAREHDLVFRLPHGSRLMDTGGAKGAPRPLSPRGVLHACWHTLAVPGYFCVNEYGMCELSSQFYDNVVIERWNGRVGRRHKVGPHWTRTLVLDPVSLAPAAVGELGVLCHYDLANAGTAMAVLTEDVGFAVGDGFELAGRAEGAEARGCSLSLAEWERADTGGSAG